MIINIFPTFTKKLLNTLAIDFGSFIFYHFDIDRGVVSVNIKVIRTLFCQPVFQFLNSMPPIILLFPLLNTNQILDQYQPVSELLT